jgi:hypothetical protein
MREATAEGWLEALTAREGGFSIAPQTFAFLYWV